MQPDSSYHHGDLRAALLRAAVDALGESGPAAISVREVARRAGVSHTAVSYHFGDKAGLLTAVAVEGYELLASAMVTARQQHRSFLEIGVAYVQFAVAHPAYFDVMYQPHLYHPGDAALQAARKQTAAVLYGTDKPSAQQLASGVAAWSIVHGLVTLWRSDNLPPQLGDDPAEITRIVASHLRVPRRRARR